MRLPSYKDYPRELLINGETWKVCFKKRMPVSDAAGLCDPESNTIYISLKQSRAELLKTFIHETIHGMEFAHEKEFPHKMVYELELMIFEFLTANIAPMEKKVTRS